MCAYCLRYSGRLSLVTPVTRASLCMLLLLLWPFFEIFPTLLVFGGSEKCASKRIVRLFVVKKERQMIKSAFCDILKTSLKTNRSHYCFRSRYFSCFSRVVFALCFSRLFLTLFCDFFTCYPGPVLVHCSRSPFFMTFVSLLLRQRYDAPFKYF